MLPTLADLCTLILAGLALVAGGWATLTGFTRAALAGEGDDAHVTAIRLRAGIGLGMAGLMIFDLGAVFCTRIIIG